MKIDNFFVKENAFSESSYKSGVALVSKSQMQNLKITADKTLLFGECKGSGKNPYVCSFDIIDEANPIGRCNCPSRQIPCKHVTALMQSFVDNYKSFKVEELPEDVARKREKISHKRTVKVVKKKPLTHKQIKSKTTSALKRINNQLVGVENASVMLNTILLDGLGSLDKSAISKLKEQINNLGNYHIDGIKKSFDYLINIMVYEFSNKIDGYPNAIKHIIHINALLNESKKVLTEKQLDPFKSILDSEIEEQVGYVWKTAELKELGLYRENVSLIQLTFNRDADEDLKIISERGVWLDLNSGKLYRTILSIPFRLKKRIKRGDSVSGVVTASEMYIYPGDNAPRIKFEESSVEEIEPSHFDKLYSYAKWNYKEIISDVKNCIKSPLQLRDPLYLIGFRELLEAESGNLYLSNSDNEKILISEKEQDKMLMKMAFNKSDRGQLALLSFSKNSSEGTLRAKVYSLVVDNKLVRLV